jgi:hypothetical protein
MDGVVTLENVGPDLGISTEAQTVAAEGSLNLASPSECNDTKSNLRKWKWRNPYELWFRGGSTPGEIAYEAAAWEVVDAAEEVTSPSNCGLSDGVSAEYVCTGV